MADPNGPTQKQSGDALSPQRRYLPLGIDVAGRKCLVVGGGRVGSRKALRLLESGAQVVVLSPDVCDRLAPAVEDGRIVWVRDCYAPERLDGYFLVIAATPEPKLNLQIARDAESRGALACVVSPGRFSPVIFPAVFEQDGMTVAVHSEGRDCRRSARVRDELEGFFRSGTAPGWFGVFGFRRGETSPDLFRALESAAVGMGPDELPARDALVLSTCQRWELYFAADSPRQIIGELIARLRDRCGVRFPAPQSRTETDPQIHADSRRYGYDKRKNDVENSTALREGRTEGDARGYSKLNTAAYYHLLRVVCGLDSSLPGETEIVGQVRAALTRWAVADESSLGRIFRSALLEQKAVRDGAGLEAVSGNWADGAARLLDTACPQAGSVALFGCGSLGKAIAFKLAERGRKVLPFSRRAGEGDVEWWPKHGPAPQKPDALPDAARAAGALVLTSELPDEVGEALAGTAPLVVIDLTGNNGEWFAGRPGVTFLDVSDVSRRPMSRDGFLRIAAAEKLIFERAAGWWAARHSNAAFRQRLRVGARGSPLSMSQTAEILSVVQVLLPGASLETVTFGSPGDRDKTTPLSQVQAEDFFTRDLDEALLRREVDLAVHSAKDLPTRVPEGLCVAALTPAFAPWECLVTRGGEALSELPSGARVGTSTGRRRDRLLQLRSDVLPAEMRGNVADRVAQVDAGQYDAALLAAVGLIRLGLQHRIAQIFPLDEFPPPPGQGSLALVVRAEDQELRRLLEHLDLGDRRGLEWDR